MAEEKPWPDFHERGLKPEIRGLRISHAAEHPDAGRKLREFSRVLKESSLESHRAAIEALLKIHDENQRNRRAIKILGAGYNHLLRRYREKKDVSIQLRGLLRFLHEKLAERKVKVEPVEEIEELNPLRPIVLGLKPPTGETALHPSVESEIRRLLSYKDKNQMFYGDKVVAAVTLDKKIDWLMTAIFGPKLNPYTSGCIYHVQDSSLRANQGTLLKIGVMIKNRHTHPTDASYTVVNLKLSEELKNFLKNYRH